MKKDIVSKQVEKILKEHYLPRYPEAIIEVYRYESCLIRIRIVERRFAGTEIPERDEEIWEIIRKHVPKEIISTITVVLLIAPEEMEDSGMNYEFEHPTPLPP
jgi:hypothetical protein